jgi:choline kinase/mannose-6-phosphate isomerase-like protein (cupin superfamily)
MNLSKKELKTVYKPWGKEEWIELNEKYCYKRIYINKGYKTSFQYHNFKHETNYIISGEAEIWLEDEYGVLNKSIMVSGDFFTVIPPRKHRVIALSDLVLQEVSTPEVDDVIRIDDEFNRDNGKIDNEHKKPAVLILTAGKGERLGNLTKNINKSLIPINNESILSKIINKFPKDYDFVIATGYKGELIKEYCGLVFPERNFTFVDVDDIDSEKSGPGYSALKCKDYLQRPFFFITCDCLIDTELPHLDGNWIGVYPTSYPEKYSTVNIDENNIITHYSNKNVNGFELAFIGLSSIWDFEIFWSELSNNIQNGEIVSAFYRPEKYPNFNAKVLEWFDTGNFDDLKRSKEHFKDSPLSLQKNNSEITYFDNGKFLKFTPNSEVLDNRVKRSYFLGKLIPNNFGNTKNFMYYDWYDGKTLYDIDDVKVYTKFLDILKSNMNTIVESNGSDIHEFYYNKTKSRLNQYIEKYGSEYYNNGYIINGVKFPSMKETFEKIDFGILLNNPLYSRFHGDLQFDNVVYNNRLNEFKYIDWRDSFGNNTNGGDIYYDLSKLYGGVIIPYNLMKSEQNIEFSESSISVVFTYSKLKNLTEFQNIYEDWLIDNGFDMNIIKLITGLIFLNMSPLHEKKFSKMLWFKSIQMLNAHDKY